MPALAFTSMVVFSPLTTTRVTGEGAACTAQRGSRALRWVWSVHVQLHRGHGGPGTPNGHSRECLADGLPQEPAMACKAGCAPAARSE